MTYSKRTFAYKTVNNHAILADVYRTPGDELRPAIIWLHGGALIFGARSGLRPAQLTRYLAAGYTVIAPDYRLAPETKLPAIIEDLQDAYAWVRTTGPNTLQIDPNRIAFVGHSAGGYLTLLAGCRLEPKPRALVAFYGYGDLTGDWYAKPDPFYNQLPAVTKEAAWATVGDEVISSAPPSFSSAGRHQFYLYCRQRGLWPREVGGHDPAAERPWFAAYEPLRNVTPAYPPTLLLHGEKDTDVPFEQSVLMAQACKQHGVAYEFVTNPEWGHGFDAQMDDGAVQAAFARVLAFLEQHLR